MTSPTPWWGTLLVAALGLLGVLLTQWLADLRERRKLAHDDGRWIRDKRAATYEDFYRVIAAFRRIAEVLGERAQAHRSARTRFGQFNAQRPVRKLYDQLGTLADDAARMYGRIRLLAPPVVVNAAGQVVEALRPYQDAQIAGEPANALRELVRRLDEAVDVMKLDLDSDRPAR